MYPEKIRSKIYELRGFKIMLDTDLAKLYRTETKVLKQAVRRNIDRFPPDFMFELTKDEYDSLRSQSVTLENKPGKHSKYLPFAFTEQGIAMISSVLKSKVAIEVNISIMRVFVFIRQYALSHKDLTEKLKELELHCNVQFDDIYDALKFLMDEKLKKDQWEERVKIGFV